VLGVCGLFSSHIPVEHHAHPTLETTALCRRTEHTLEGSNLPAWFSSETTECSSIDFVLWVYIKLTPMDESPSGEANSHSAAQQNPRLFYGTESFKSSSYELYSLLLTLQQSVTPHVQRLTTLGDTRDFFLFFHYIY
jgi:hypothetical protein